MTHLCLYQVLALFKATLEAGPGLAFNLAVGDALMEQRPMYEGEEEQRGGLSMLLGVVFSLVEEGTYVRVGLHEVFWETAHLSALERAGCARCFQAAARRHFGAAVEVLEDILKKDHASNSSVRSSLSSLTAGFLAVSKRVRKVLEHDENEPQIATALLACGQVVREASIELLHQHLHSILAIAHPCLPGGARYHFVRGAKINFISLVGQAVMANNAFLHEHVIMDHVDKVLQAVPQLITFVRDPVTKTALEEQNIEAIAAMLTACSDLASLRPGFSRRAFVPLVHAITPMFDLLSEVQECGPTMRKLYQGVSLALQSGVQNHPSLQMVYEVARALEKSFAANSDSERLRACALTCALLHTVAIAQLRSQGSTKRIADAKGTGESTLPSTSPNASPASASGATRGGRGGKTARIEEEGGGGGGQAEQAAELIALLLPRVADCSSRVAQVATAAVRTASLLASLPSPSFPLSSSAIGASTTSSTDKTESSNNGSGHVTEPSHVLAASGTLEPFPDVEWVMGEAGAPEEVWDWGSAPAGRGGGGTGDNFAVPGMICIVSYLLICMSLT